VFPGVTGIGKHGLPAPSKIRTAFEHCDRRCARAGTLLGQRARHFTKAIVLRFFDETRAINWLLPALFAAAWLVLQVLRRPWFKRFFAIAAALSFLCFPIAIIVGRAETHSEACAQHPVMCITDTEIAWWANGIYGLLCWVVLLVLTGVVELVAELVRVIRRSATQPDRSTDIQR
jgi:hypothetical protein